MGVIMGVLSLQPAASPQKVRNPSAARCRAGEKQPLTIPAPRRRMPQVAAEGIGASITASFRDEAGKAHGEAHVTNRMPTPVIASVPISIAQKV